MKPWAKHLCKTWFLSDKRVPKAKASVRPGLEALESRETPNSLANLLLPASWEPPDDLASPSYAVAPGWDPTPGMTADPGDGSSGATGSGEGGSSGGAGATAPPSDNFSAGDPSAAASAIDLDANLFASVLGGDNASFAANVATAVGASGGGGGGGGGAGAAVVVGLATPATAGATSGGTQGGNTNPPAVTPGPPPALSAAPGTAETVGVGLSASDFGLNPFTLRSGATVSALTPFVVGSGMAVPAAQSGGGTVATSGWAPTASGTSSSGGSYTQTTTDAFAFNASETTTADGGLNYQESYSFQYDVQTTPTSPGGAAVHDWGASGYTFLATDDGGQYAFTLTATLASYETGAQTQTTTADDGSTSASATIWQSTAQYERTITNATVQATGAATGSNAGGGLTTQSSSTTGTYSSPISVGVFGGVGTVSGVQGSASSQGASYQFSLTAARDAGGAVTQAGMWNDASVGYAGDSYSGSGSYSIPAASGSASGGSTTPSISAVPDATAVPSASGGPYADGASVMGGGLYTEAGADSSSSGYSDQYTLQSNGSWQASSGSGQSNGDGWTQSNYSGSGGYGYALAGGSVSGSWQEGGGSETNDATSTDSTLSGSGVWTDTGTSSSGDGGGQYDAYQGSGSYAINSAPPSASGSSSASGSGSGSSSGSASGSASASGSGSGSSSGSGYATGSGSSSSGVVVGTVVAVSPSPLPSASGGLSAPGAAFQGTGTVTESAGDSSGYADNSTSTLASDGSWQPANGSGWTDASGFTQWGYVASGAYGYALVGGAVNGTWQQNGTDNTTYNTSTNDTQSGSANAAYSGSQTNGETSGQHSSYSGSGSYLIGAGWDGWFSGTTAAIALAGAGAVLESGSDDWGYGYATQAQMSGDGSWLPATGSGLTREISAALLLRQPSIDGLSMSQLVSSRALRVSVAHQSKVDGTLWAYSASGSYSRPSDAGTLQGVWQATGGSATGFTEQSPATLNPDGTWTITGVASSSGSGCGNWSYAGSASSSSTSSYGSASNGGDSSTSAQISESYGQGWSSQYQVLSTLAADGAVTTITTASASGSDSGSHGYASSGTLDSWYGTGDYAGGNGTRSESDYTSGLALTETVQGQWQEGYVISSLPGQATTTVGGSSGSSQASGDAAFANSYASESDSDSSGSGYSDDSGYGNTDSSGGADHYLDQATWSQGYAADGSSSSASTSSNQIWGDLLSQWDDSNGYSSQGSGSGWSGGSSSGGSGSGSYDQTTYSPGFGGETGAHDGAWVWGQGGYGTAHAGPLGPSAFRGVGYAFAPGDPVSVADVADQSNTEGDAVSLQIQASDWSASGMGSGMASGSGSGSPYGASGLPAGLSISATGLISGTLLPGDAAAGPYFVTATYTDGAGNTAGQAFEWNVADPVNATDASGLEPKMNATRLIGPHVLLAGDRDDLLGDRRARRDEEIARIQTEIQEEQSRRASILSLMTNLQDKLRSITIEIF